MGDEPDEKNTNLDTPLSLIIEDGLSKVAPSAASGQNFSTEKLEVNRESLTANMEISLEDTIQYPTGFPLALIIVALILSIFLVAFPRVHSFLFYRF